MKNPKKELVILGTGFGAFTLLKSLDYKKFNITVISPRDHFLFTPLLPGSAVGSVELRSIIEPIKVVNNNIKFVQAYATTLDAENKKLVCNNTSDNYEFIINYDVLIITVGLANNTFDIPGVQENALFLKEILDARHIRQRIIANFEKASSPTLPESEIKKLLSFVVVGGGPTGVEFSAELSDFLEEDIIKTYPLISKYASITLVEAGKNILSYFDKKLSEYAMQHFERSSINLRINSSVRNVEKDRIVLDDESEIPFGMLVWAAGVGPTEFVKSLPFPKDSYGRLITTENFMIPSQNFIFAIGDCSTIENMDLPASAQVAMQGAKFLAMFLNDHDDYEKVTDHIFKYKHLGMFAYIGDNKALAGLPFSKTSGFSAWVFWRAAYLTHLVSFKNKVLVLFDWIKTGFFGRDINTL
jgi:NADH:ubiquinone reductase (non-electrogenic)